MWPALTRSMTPSISSLSWHIVSLLIAMMPCLHLSSRSPTSPTLWESSRVWGNFTAYLFPWWSQSLSPNLQWQVMCLLTQPCSLNCELSSFICLGIGAVHIFNKGEISFFVFCSPGCLWLAAVRKGKKTSLYHHLKWGDPIIPLVTWDWKAYWISSPQDTQPSNMS